MEKTDTPAITELLVYAAACRVHTHLVGQTYVYSIRAISSLTSLLQEHSPLNNSLRRMVTKMTLNI